MVQIFLAILAFGAIVFWHELGHFLVARRFGVAVRQFSIGFGPAIFRWFRNDVLFCLRAIPFGGYVMMAQGDEQPDDLQPEYLTPENAPLPARLLLPKEMLDHYVEGHNLEERITYGDEPLNGLPFSKLPVFKRLLIVIAGPVQNVLLGLVLLCVLMAFQPNYAGCTIGAFRQGAAAAQSLQVGDRIQAVNGRACYVPNDFLYELSRAEKETADFTVLRDGNKIVLEDVPFLTEITVDGVSGSILGFTVLTIEKTPVSMVTQAVNYTRFYGHIVLISLMDLFAGREDIRSLSGPVGVTQAISQAAGYGWQDFLNILALISINLAICNCLPLPVLDGGQAVLLLVEGILHRPINEKLRRMLYAATASLLLTFMIFITLQDFLRLFQ